MTPASPAHSKQQTPAAEAEDYETILAAVSETPRGRWFLAEYARRNRSADTDIVVQEIARLETLLALGNPKIAAQRSQSALTDLATVMALSADGTDAGSEGLTPEVVAQLALGVGQSGDNIREALLTVRGALIALRDSRNDPARATRFAGALDRQIAAIDDQAGAVVQSSRRIEALAQVIGQMRARLRVLLQSGLPPAAEPMSDTQAQPQPSVAAPPARIARIPSAVAAEPEQAFEPDEPPPAFEQVWQPPAAPSHSRLRHVAALMQDAVPQNDDGIEENSPLVVLAQSARTAHAGRSLAELDRLSYTERAALFA